MAEATRTSPTGSGSTTIQDQAAASTCCGGPAPRGTDACCARDAGVKSTGGTGCGCGSAAPAAAAPKKTGFSHTGDVKASRGR